RPGAAGRLLRARPPRRPKRWTDAELPQEVSEKYGALLDCLLKLQYEEDPDGQPVPSRLTLTAEAKEEWVGYYNRWAEEQEGADGDLAAAFAKIEAYCARFALIHHVVTHVGLGSSDRRPVGAVSVRQAIRLADWFAREAERIYAALGEDEEARERRTLAEYVQARGGRITARDLHRARPKKYPRAEDAEAAL